MFAPPAVSGPRRRYEANFGTLGELRPRGARISAMPRRDSARKTSREAGEKPTTSNPTTSKNAKKQTRLDIDLYGGDEGEADTTAGRAPAPCACPRAPCRNGRVERLSMKTGWPSRRRRRACAVVKGPRLQKQNTTVSASRSVRS